MKRYIIPAEKRAVLENLKQPFAIYQFLDKKAVTLLLSDGFCDLFGFPERDEAVRVMDNDMYKYAHPDDIARISEAAMRFSTEDGKYEVVYRTKKNMGSDYIIVHAVGEHVTTETGARVSQVWYMNESSYIDGDVPAELDVTGQLDKSLNKESFIKENKFDYLTGLPNMTYFFERADEEKKVILKRGDQPVVLYIDFSGMKFFNVKHGFTEGNKMLRAFARLMTAVFSNVNCCRIGADHFAAITEEAGLEDRLNGIFREFGGLCGGKTPPVHVGVYPYRIEDVPASMACERAKLACNKIKGSYVSGFNYYSADLLEKAMLKQYVIENIDTALREKWIQVYLQPIIRSVNERICDVEALARWIDPEKGFLSPASFIPALEESGLIYKLDLYMVDRVLEIIKSQQDEGLYVVPHSINLSRSDFDVCDIVEEIRKRVDAAGVAHDRITIEITESIIGRDFEFMKEQVERFQSLGFPVWMDDFGNGYSSLDVLQSIKFNLLKFDMSFMRKLDEGGDGKTVLTELMRMATALGIDTVCEGVEKESQMQFLREIGCSKLQGFYYSKPIPFEAVWEKRKNGGSIEHENPEESGYYETIGRVNLFDLSVIAEEDKESLQNTFDTIPMGLIEVKDEKVGLLRSNHPFKEFVSRFFGEDFLEGLLKYSAPTDGFGSEFVTVIKQSCLNRKHHLGGSRIFFDERMSDGSVVHCFARRIDVNPVTGSTAVAVTILSVSEPDESTTFADLARALSADYYNIYVVNLDTDDYIEYASRVGGEELLIERHGNDFFNVARYDALYRVYEEDRESFLTLFTKENVLRDLDEQGSFTVTYRQIDTGTPIYANLKATRMRGGNRIIIGVSIIEAHMREKRRLEEMRKEREMLIRVMALSDGYLSMFTVDPKTGKYIECSSSDDFDSLGAEKVGEDFFRQVYTDAFKHCCEEDKQRFREQVTKENVLRQIQEKGKFSIEYRLVIKGVPRPVTLKAALFKEGDEEKLVVGLRAWKERNPRYQ